MTITQAGKVKVAAGEEAEGNYEWVRLGLGCCGQLGVDVNGVLGAGMGA